MDPLAPAVLAAGFGCFAAFLWATRKHFVLHGGMPNPMRVLTLFSFVGAIWFAARIVTSGVGPGAPYAIALMAVSFGLFWWAIRTTRQRRPLLAFVDGVPETLNVHGPYRYIRHPFYTSYLLCWGATSLATRGIWSWAVPAGMMVIYGYLARTEERTLRASALAGAYDAYRSRTGMFLPTFRRHGFKRRAVVSATVEGNPGSPFASVASDIPRTQKAPSGPDRLEQPKGAWTYQLADLLQWLRPGKLLDYSDDVAVEQAWLLSRICYVYALFGSTTVLLLLLDFSDRMGPAGFVVVATLPIFYALIMLRVRTLVRTNDTAGFLRVTVPLLACVGVIWGGLVIYLGEVCSRSEQTLLGALMVGLVATPIITVPFSAAIAFLIPCGLASLVTLFAVLKPFDPFLFLCFLGFVSFTYVSTVLLNRSSLERSSTRLRLQHQNEVISLFLREHQESATEWVWEVDANLQFQNISPRFKQALKTLPEEMRQMPLREFAVAAEGTLITGLTALIALFDNRQAFRDAVLRFDLGSETRWWSIVGQPIYDANARFRGYRGIGSDITEARRSEDKISYLANHDSLTGLPNRARLMLELESFCQKAANSEEAAFALLLLDLDRFKEINDTHGHPTGDALLVLVAERLRRVLRADGFPARLGGDEFAILMPVSDPADAAIVAERIIRTLGEPYALRDALVRPGASIGITIGPADGTEPATLMRNADLALYTAKGGGRGAWRCYRSGMHAEQADRASLRSDLKNATESNDFELEYQPIIDLRTRGIVAMEALVRWNHRTRGAIPPSVFIPLAEESGLIPEIGALVLKRACKAAARWPHYVALAVNLSALQTRDPDFLKRVDAALAESALSPERLELELTERVLLGDDETSFQVIASLRRRGVRVILDDFGTGYSSLATLTRFDFDGFKIDREFTASIETDERARVILRSIVQIAADLRRPVTAEGIETAEQFRTLVELGISRGQGFFIGKPQDATELFDFAA